jgi:putative acetyltransferase
MADAVSVLQVAPVHTRDPEVIFLLDELTSELALSGYAESEMFGYSIAQLEQSQVHLVGARAGRQLVGVGGVELQGGGVGELKRFYVLPDHRGAGVADAVITVLIGYAGDHDTQLLRLETGDKQRAAIAFYQRHGFVEIPRFGPYLRSATSVCMERRLNPGDGDPAEQPPDAPEPNEAAQ